MTETERQPSLPLGARGQTQSGSGTRGGLWRGRCADKPSQCPTEGVLGVALGVCAPPFSGTNDEASVDRFWITAGFEQTACEGPVGAGRTGVHEFDSCLFSGAARGGDDSAWLSPLGGAWSSQCRPHSLISMQSLVVKSGNQDVAVKRSCWRRRTMGGFPVVTTERMESRLFYVSHYRK